MSRRVSTDIDVERAWQLYQMRGATFKDVAYSMNTTVIEVRAALAQHAKWGRQDALKQIKAQQVVNAERKLFNKAMPHIKDDEGDAWKAWLARSRLKV